ncbi:MAG: hypothetical protein KH050_08545 [Clostridiaceae bacterium]|nr:hypothetical protein [Clostridiaceae bacterium]
MKVNIDSQEILKKRGMGASDRTRLFLANEVARLCDPYVPMNQGTLKNTHVIARGGRQLIYTMPYAHYQYEGKVYGPNIPLKDGGFISPIAPKHPTGKALTYQGAPMRGAHWDKRMKADRMDDLVQSVANHVGGKPK